MKSVRPAFGCLMTFCVIAIAGFQSILAAQPRAQEDARPKSPNGPHIMDVELAAGGTLSGALVDSNGAPVPGSMVSIRHQGGPDTAVETNDRGQFQVPGLRGGVYEIHTVHGGGIVRAWAPRTAPPSALEGIVLVARRNVVRGQQPSSPYQSSTNSYSPSPNSYSPNSYSPNSYSPNSYSPNSYNPNSYSPNSPPSTGYSPAPTYPRTARNSNFPTGSYGPSASNTSPSAGSNWRASTGSSPTTGTYGSGLSNTNPPTGTYGAPPRNTNPPTGNYGAPPSNPNPSAGNYRSAAANPNPSVGSYGLAPSNTSPSARNYGLTSPNTSPPAGSYRSALSGPSPSTGSHGFTSSNLNPPTGTSGLTTSSPAPPSTGLYGPQPQYSSVPNEFGSMPGPATSPAVTYDMSPAVVNESPRGFRGYMRRNGPLILDLVNLGLGITGTTLGTIAILDDDDAS